MNRGLIDDRKTLWLMLYASNAFKHARIAGDYIRQKELTIRDPLFYSLCTSLVVNYAKPFTNSHGLGRGFGENKLAPLIPEPLIATHKQIMEFRNENFAHADTKESSYNIVRLVISKDGNRTLCPHFPFPNRKFFEDASTLLDELWRKTQYHIKKLQNKYIRRLPTQCGEYVINLEPSQDIFWDRAEPMPEGIELQPEYSL